MDPVTARLQAASCPTDDESGLDPEKQLASSIRRHFGALADALSRTAELIGDTPDGHRLRAAAAAADRGKASADRLCSKLAAGTEQPAPMKRRA